MSMSLAVNSLVQNLPTKPPLIDRTHYSGPSGASTHRHSHHHHSSSSSKGSSKHGIALTALTLLSFLFFLNILQNCVQEHMETMNNNNNAAAPQIVIMPAQAKEQREIEAQKRKGEVHYFNSSLNKEQRNNPEEKFKMANNYEMAQIPVKLRTNEKAVKP